MTDRKSITPTILYACTHSITNYSMPNSEQSSTPAGSVRYHLTPFTPFTPRLPEHLNQHLNEAFSPEKSIELDKWLWYCQQEFEGVQS